MPTDKNILGFSNDWYQEAVEYSLTTTLNNGVNIDVVSPVYFLATKLCAFYGRGQDDFLGSHDLEDIIALIDGRHEIVEDVSQASDSVKSYLAREFKQLLKNNRFNSALPGHLNYGALTSAREQILLEKLNTISSLCVA